MPSSQPGDSRTQTQTREEGEIAPQQSQGSESWSAERHRWFTESKELKRKADAAEYRCERLQHEVKRRKAERAELMRRVARVCGRVVLREGDKGTKGIVMGDEATEGDGNECQGVHDSGTHECREEREAREENDILGVSSLLAFVSPLFSCCRLGLGFCKGRMKLLVRTTACLYMAELFSNSWGITFVFVATYASPLWRSLITP